MWSKCINLFFSHLYRALKPEALSTFRTKEIYRGLKGTFPLILGRSSSPIWKLKCSHPQCSFSHVGPVITESRKRRWTGHCAFLSRTFLGGQQTWEQRVSRPRRTPNVHGELSPVFRKERGKEIEVWAGKGSQHWPGRRENTRACCQHFYRRGTSVQGGFPRTWYMGTASTWSAFKSEMNHFYFPSQRCFMFPIWNILHQQAPRRMASITVNCHLLCSGTKALLLWISKWAQRRIIIFGVQINK